MYIESTSSMRIIYVFIFIVIHGGIRFIVIGGDDIMFVLLLLITYYCISTTSIIIVHTIL